MSEPKDSDSGVYRQGEAEPGDRESGLRRFLSRWGFPLFFVAVVVLGRAVLLPFVFAGLIAYILAPVVKWMSERKDGTRRMPRGLAIIGCYILFLAAVTGFLFLLVPRLSNDIARLGKEAPGLYKKIKRSTRRRSRAGSSAGSRRWRAGMRRPRSRPSFPTCRCRRAPPSR